MMAIIIVLLVVIMVSIGEGRFTALTDYQFPQFRFEFSSWSQRGPLCS